MQTKAAARPLHPQRPSSGERLDEKAFDVKPAKGGAIFGLVRDVFSASRIAQSAKRRHLGVHNFDKAQALIEHATERPPLLVILDWDTCEAEAFKVLKSLNETSLLKGIPAVGYISHSKTDLKEVAERAGCLRVYSKTEFMRVLDDLLVRYAS